MVLVSFFLVIAGLFSLVKGGDILIDGCVALAKRAKLSNMVIGIVVIGFGTSTPELLVSTQAAIVGSSGLAIGNVVGSNIANLALILGLTSIISPLPADSTALRRDLPFMVFAIIALVVVGMSGDIYRWEGLLFILALVSYMAYRVRMSRKLEKAVGSTASATPDAPCMSLRKALFVSACSIITLIFGANMLIFGASDIARTLGAALGAEASAMERIIGLTIVAVGTSLPELTATVMAARKQQADMALGNIIGSVSFNIFCVIGVASAVCPIRHSAQGFTFDYLLMFGVAVLLSAVLYSRHRITRSAGWTLTVIYILYIARTLLVIQS